jgi:hypothetical protein
MERTRDLKHYFLLAAILSFGFGFFWLFNYNRQIQMGIILVMAAAYVVWGTFYHIIKKDLHWRIFIEYLVVAILAAIAVIFLLLRA